VAQPRNRPPTSSCCSCHHAARTRPRWPPGPSNEAYLSSPHLEASPATTFRACSSPAPTRAKPQPAPAILTKNQSTQCCQSLVTQGSDHPPVLEPHMVLSHFHRSRTPTLLLKSDISKAFDSVRWDYLLSLMQQMGFPTCWCNWVSAILSTSSSRVLLNGSPLPPILHGRGLR
jgi:hypothetical protein